MGRRAWGGLVVVVIVLVAAVVVTLASAGENRMSSIEHPAGRITLRAYGADGQPLTWSQFRQVQTGGAGGGGGVKGAIPAEDGANDALVDAGTLRVIRPWPLAGTGTVITFDRPAGAVALSLAWPSSAGYSTLILDLPRPGSYVLNQLAARQAVNDVAAALVARSDYLPSPAFSAAWLTARTELAAADRASDDADRAVHGTRGYDAGVRAQLLLITEYGTQYAARTRSSRHPAWGFTLDTLDTLDSPGTLDAALRAVTGIVAGAHGEAAVRLVFDATAPPEQYAAVVDAAHRAGISVVGQFLDSSDLARTGQALWQQRVKRYVAALPGVDTWEVGNEVNGNWAGAGVADKVAFAASWVKAHTRARTLLTLYWQLGEDVPEHSMFTWAARHLSASMAGIDEIGMSVYPENAPLGVAFDRVFRALHAAYPGQELSISELGYGSPDLDHRWWWGDRGDWTGAGRRAVADLYGRAVLGYPYSAGGTYWWYFATEARSGSPLWLTLAALHASVAGGIPPTGAR